MTSAVSRTRRLLSREVSAVDRELGAGDVDGVVGGEEGDGGGDLLRLGATRALMTLAEDQLARRVDR
jgi:hypothetical protein